MDQAREPPSLTTCDCPYPETPVELLAFFLLLCVWLCREQLWVLKGPVLSLHHPGCVSVLSELSCLTAWHCVPHVSLLALFTEPAWVGIQGWPWSS